MKRIIGKSISALSIFAPYIPALSACSTVFIWMTPSATAAPLLTGGTLFPAPAEPDPVGGVTVASMTQPFSSPTFTGTLTSTVITGDLSNPFGGLTFTYLVHNNDVSAHPLTRLTVNGFDGFMTDASFQAPGLGRAPTLVNRPQDDYVGFSFIEIIGPGPITPGMDSALLVVQTNAPGYDSDFASVIDGFVATVPTLSAVPEPATLALVGIGVAALLKRRSRRI